MIKRSETNDYRPYGGMEQKDHVLRLARGALAEGLNLAQFIELLKIYVDGNDDTVLDKAPLIGYWNLGGGMPENKDGGFVTYTLCRQCNSLVPVGNIVKNMDMCVDCYLGGGRKAA